MSRLLPLGLSLSLLAGAAATLLACPASLDDRCTEGACTDTDATTTAGGDGGAVLFDGGPALVPTDPCLEDPSAPKCIDETKAFFVSASTGHDDAPGTKAAPLATIGAALAKVGEGRLRIYVCPGEYKENLVLDAAQAGVALYGNLTCSFDAPAAEKPRLGGSPHPLVVRNATGIAISDLIVTATDATTPSDSSIPLFASNAALTLQRVDLSAGNGANGADASVTPFDYSSLNLRGNDATSTRPGAAKTVVCPGNLVTVGGAGGNTSEDGGNGRPQDDTNPNGLPLLGCALSPGMDAWPGKPGRPGSDGRGGAGLGTLDVDGFHPEPGEPGAVGEPGQGGGGGAGNAPSGTGNYGGSGGAGGCGGAGGSAAGAGGASIALLCGGCSVSVRAGTFSTQRGGIGGNGTSGALGQPDGGAKGLGTGAGCHGGQGGGGGKGGASGGGGGGVSAAIVYKTPTPPVLDTSSVTHVGTPGSGGGGPHYAGAVGATGDLLAIP